MIDFLTYTLFGYLGLATIYYLVFSVASRFRRKTKERTLGTYLNTIAVFIPAYKEDAIIFDTALDALRQDYPGNLYEVVVIADSLKDSTLRQLKELPITVEEVAFEKSTKTRAINETFKRIEDSFDIVVVLDADNVMETSFLSKVNQAYNLGAMAIQGHRVAKNQNTTMAILDAISEEVNNRIFRKGHRNLGLSSALIGSGMAFDFKLFRDYMSRIDAIGGFDKELELSLLRDGITIEYLEDAYVFDEKVSNAEVFTNQRTRWIAAQIRYGLGSFGKAFMHLITKGNADYFDKSLQFLMPPRLILLGILTISGLVGLLLPPVGYLFSGLFGLYCIALVIAVPGKHFNKKTLRACVQIPKTFFLMIYAIGGYKKAKTNFLHTPHSNH